MYSTTISGSLDDASLGPIMAFLGAYMLVFAVVGILLIVANWRIFTKSGEAGWKAIIPIYNEYTAFKLFWQTKFFWVMVGTSVVTGIINLIGAQFDAGSAATMIFTLLAAAVSIAGIIISILKMHKMSVSFGHGVGFTLGLIFLNPIFLLILAFGSSQYQGPQQ